MRLADHEHEWLFRDSGRGRSPPRSIGRQSRAKKISASLAEDESIAPVLPSQPYRYAAEDAPQQGFADAGRGRRVDPSRDVSHARRHRRRARHRPNDGRDVRTTHLREARSQQASRGCEASRGCRLDTAAGGPTIARSTRPTNRRVATGLDRFSGISHPFWRGRLTGCAVWDLSHFGRCRGDRGRHIVTAVSPCSRRRPARGSP